MNDATRQNNGDVLRHYPPVEAPPQGQVLELTLGDLHANALTLAYVLIRAGVFQIDAAGYARLYDLYNRLDEFPPYRQRLDFVEIKRLTQAFCQIIAAAPVNAARIKIRLLGDELADRGASDFLILEIIKKLDRAKVPLEILFSNHGQIFLDAVREAMADQGEVKRVSFRHGHVVETSYRPPGIGLGAPPKFAEQSKSLIQAGYLAAHHAGDFSTARLGQIITRHYLPHIRLLSYKIAGADLTIYTHAPICFRVMKKLADYFSVAYRDDSIEALAHTIDGVNGVFHKQLLAGTLRVDACMETMVDPGRYPIYHLLWNRGPRAKADWEAGLPDALAGHVRYVHGHDGAGQRLRPDAQNLDSHFGKTVFWEDDDAYRPLREAQWLYDGRLNVIAELTASRPEG